MYKGNWKCSGCGGVITELPFEPRGAGGLTCRTCYAKGKANENTAAPEVDVAEEMLNDIPEEAGLASEPQPDDDLGMGEVPATNERPTFTGDWTCSGCGTAITSLPFEPRGTSGLKCIDCFKKGKS